MNLGEHLNLFLRNKGTTVNFHREQGNMHPPPPPPEALTFSLQATILNILQLLVLNRIVGGGVMTEVEHWVAIHSHNTLIPWPTYIAKLKAMF